MSLPTKILRKYKHWRNNFGAILGFSHRFYKNASGCRILIYHGICEQDHTRFNAIFLKKDIFERHLRYYKRYFNVISLDDYYHQRFREDRFNICITFDDGFANNYRHVLPLLEKYQVPATFFITGIRDAGFDVLWNDFLGIMQQHGPATLTFNDQHFIKSHSGAYLSGKNNLKAISLFEGFAAKKALIQAFYPVLSGIDADYWLQMTPEQIKELSASPLVSIGAHGYYHNDLAKIPLEYARKEMIASKEYLERITGKSIAAIAFPYGSYSPAVKVVAKDLNYKQLLAMDFLSPVDHTDPVMRERLTINPFISVHNQLYAIIKGIYT